MADVLNQELREDQPFQESAYRKPFQSASLYYQNVFSKMKSDDDYSKQLQLQKDELYMLKKQYFDQRREYNKLLDVDARWNNLVDRLTDVAQSLNENKPLLGSTVPLSVGEKEAVLVLNDWHFGMTADNIFNKYNVQICKERVAYVLRRTITHVKTHGVRNVHVLLLGDLANGSLHTSSRVASEEDTCDQVMNVSEIIAELVNSLASNVESVKVYSTYGNHLRTVQNKKDSIHSDNMEKLIPWWLRQRLHNTPNVEIVDSDYYEFVRLNVLGHHICAVHGDLDKIKDIGVTVNTIFTQRYGEVINYAIMADKHHIEEFDRFGIESIICPSLCGVDEYANINRLYSKPAQTLMIFSREEGRECTYNIKV